MRPSFEISSPSNPELHVPWFCGLVFVRSKNNGRSSPVVSPNVVHAPPPYTTPTQTSTQFFSETPSRPTLEMPPNPEMNVPPPYTTPTETSTRVFNEPPSRPTLEMSSPSNPELHVPWFCGLVFVRPKSHKRNLAGVVPTVDHAQPLYAAP